MKLIIMDKRLILPVVLLASAVAAGAQTERRIYTKAEQESAQKRTRQEYVQKREQEKRIEAIQDSIRSVEAFAALEQLDFMLEANRLSFKRGETAYVTSNTNFVSLSDDKAVIQIGRASNIKLKTDKKGNVTFTMSVSGTGLSATVDISLPKNSYMASVTVTPNFHSNRVTLYGILLPAGKSDVFKGWAP